MLTDVYGIKQFQSQLPAIAKQISQIGGHYIVTRRSKPAFVAIPFADYQEIQDILLELNSPKLQKDIFQARKEIQEGKGTSLEDVLKEFDVKLD